MRAVGDACPYGCGICHNSRQEQAPALRRVRAFFPYFGQIWNLPLRFVLFIVIRVVFRGVGFAPLLRAVGDACPYGARNENDIDKLNYQMLRINNPPSTIVALPPFTRGALGKVFAWVSVRDTPPALRRVRAFFPYFGQIWNLPLRVWQMP